MKDYDIQPIISKYIHSDPDIVQDMVLEYRNYGSNFLDPVSKIVNDFRYAISPWGYTTQCGFVQGATYRLLFQNQNIKNILLIAISDEVSKATTLESGNLKNSLYDIQSYTSEIYSDLEFDISEDTGLFEKCINQLIYIYSYQKIDNVSMLLLPPGYKDIKKIIDQDKIKINNNLGIVFVANFVSYDSSIQTLTKDDFINQNQIILDRFFTNKMTKKNKFGELLKDYEIFSNFSSSFSKKNPVLSMYYDTFRLGNKAASSFVGMVV